MERIQQRLEATVTDRIGVILETVVDPMIQMELSFEGRLDADRLEHAFDLILDAEPVLGCRFVERWGRPFWERIPRPGRANFKEAGGKDDYEGFRAESLDPYAGPLVRACLSRGDGGDRLLVKVSHAAADAGAVKEIVRLAASIYMRLEREPGFAPEPNLRGSRSITQVFRRVPWRDYPLIFFRHLRASREFMLSAAHTVPLQEGERGPVAFARRVITPGRTAFLSEYGRRRGATLNDVMVAAFLRAMASFAWDGRAPMRLATTVDLRRYLPGGRGEGVCNLSAFEFIGLGADPGMDFETTLARVSASTMEKKKNWIGLGDYTALVPLSGLLPYRWMRSAFSGLLGMTAMRSNLSLPLTNMGPIDPDGVSFGLWPRDAWLIPPPVYPDRFGAGMSGYAGALSLSAGFVPSSMKGMTAGEFFDRVLSQIPGDE